MKTIAGASDQGVASSNFDEWVRDRRLHSIGTNFGSETIAFQSWMKFKESFAPELIERAVRESRREVQSILDPFGGSGTTALAAQFLGVRATSCEVSPLLADLTEAKLTKYDLGALTRDIARVVQTVLNLGPIASDSYQPFEHRTLPPTFIEPGVDGRWIYSCDLARVLSRTIDAIHEIENEAHQRLMRVVLAGQLVPLSNVRVSGKGRRYRGGWKQRQTSATDATQSIARALETALNDVAQFNMRPCMDYEVVRGDSRLTLEDIGQHDLAVFSPPYPNSFDYTDVYNVELWTLGYLNSTTQNRTLRTSTLISHLQVNRDFKAHPLGSSTLEETIASLRDTADTLWDRRIPAMVSSYFSDLSEVLKGVNYALNEGGEAWVVVGDSRYAGIDVPVAKILGELAPVLGFELISNESFRSMRASPQQGGREDLSESLLLMRKD